MSEPENFLTRWSRRKRTGAEPAAKPQAEGARVEAKEEEKEAVEKASVERAPDAAETPAFDLSSLPPLESIGAGTDIRPFLAPGVPAELTRAALRRAWTSDPAIRDFIGLSENSWDFTKAEVHGFGPLLPTDDVKKLVAEIFSRRGEAGPREPEPDSMIVAAADPKEIERRSRDVEKTIDDPASLQGNMIDQRVTEDASSENDALQNKSQSDAAGHPAPKRSHGGALPE